MCRGGLWPVLQVSCTFHATYNRLRCSLLYMSYFSTTKMAASMPENPNGGQGDLPSPRQRQIEVDAGKAVADFRIYEMDPNSIVYRHYEAMRKNQCVAFVDKMEAKWLKFDHGRMTIREAFEVLKGYVDSSDPDTTNPNLEHMVQTAEAMRAAGRPDWMQLIGLIHDMGKIMFKWGLREEGQNGDAASPQFALGGDTWVVGCPIPDCTVLPHLNQLNPDRDHPVYGAGPHGMYQPGCGIMNLRFAFGHDEYMYRMVLHNKCPFPAEGLAMLRLHSCYPWHRGGAYRQFHAPDGSDEKLVEAVNDFNQFDLYTKASARPDVAALWPYYQGLIDKYMPGSLAW